MSSSLKSCLQRLPLLVSASIVLCAQGALSHSIHGPAPVPTNGVSWDIFGATKAVPWIDQAGVNRLEPHFSDQVEALDNQQITVAGFALPDGTPKTTFTLYATEADCEFHAPADPSHRAQVVTKSPMIFDNGVITVTGRLELVRARQGGVFYRIYAEKITQEPPHAH